MNSRTTRTTRRSKASNRTTRVLIIDDDPSFLELMARLLRGYVCVVQTAMSAEDGLAAARRVPPDVILIGYQMPNAEGFELLERLSREDDLASIPRVVIANGRRAEPLRELFRWDTAAVLTKPIGKTELVAAVEKAIRRKLRVPPSDITPTEPPPPCFQAPEETADSVAIKFTSAEADSNAPAVKAVSEIIRLAIARDASDIHIEPAARGLNVRMRVDGQLISAASYPLALACAVAARLKVMASLDIAERRLPQDGRVAVEAGSKRVDFRVSTLPSLYGEKLVLRLVGALRVDGDLTKLGLAGRELKLVEWALAQPNGLILLTGPTGSGKTTTLYRMLSRLNDGKRNIITIEDPVEGELEGVTQVAVHAEIGLTFEKALRAFVRQDPDVMLVGEIRDAETAEICARAALTGRLIMSTLHANDSVGSFPRLAGMKVPPYMIAGSVRLVIAQRLVRLLCRKCKREDAPGPAELQALRAAGLPFDKVSIPAGCPECGMLGYAGRAPVMELLALRSAALRDMVRDEAPVDSLRAQAEREGMIPLVNAGLALVADGRTSFAEALQAASID